MSLKTTEIIQLNGKNIPFIIENKKIKNTYFRFRDGKVYISKSKRMSMKQLGKYIHENKEAFIEKTARSMRYVTTEKSYFLFGELYTIVSSDSNKVEIDSIHKTIAFPSDKARDRYEKKALLTRINDLHNHYQSNPYILLDGCTYSVRKMKSRYGSCQPSTKKIRINQKLVHYPPEYLAYVYCHEITHLNEANHSKSFYDLLEKIYPNYKQIRKELK